MHARMNVSWSLLGLAPGKKMALRDLCGAPLPRRERAQTAAGSKQTVSRGSDFPGNTASILWVWSRVLRVVKARNMFPLGSCF